MGTSSVGQSDGISQPLGKAHEWRCRTHGLADQAMPVELPIAANSFSSSIDQCSGGIQFQTGHARAPGIGSTPRYAAVSKQEQHAADWLVSGALRASASQAVATSASI